MMNQKEINKRKMHSMKIEKLASLPGVMLKQLASLKEEGKERVPTLSRFNNFS